MSDLIRLKRLRNSDVWHLSPACSDWPQDAEISNFIWVETLDDLPVCSYCRQAGAREADILH